MPNDTDAERPGRQRIGMPAHKRIYRAFRALLFENLGTHSLSPSLQDKSGTFPGTEIVWFERWHLPTPEGDGRKWFLPLPTGEARPGKRSRLSSLS
jgi:hypothetical protein